jgi:hypothetical protein
MTEAEARRIAMSHMAPGSKFVKSVSHGDFFIFQINGPDPAEGNLDPFFSVHKRTGEFRDFHLPDGGLELIRQFTG